MGKKYLNLEEAADRLGMSSDELTQLREQGEIRGFADRGNWKFREQDVEEFARSQEADSSPDIPIITDPDASVLEEDDAAELTSSDSDVRLSFDESLFDDGDAGAENSDSDVRLSGDSGPKLEAEESGLDLTGWDDDDKDSDSDVNLVGQDGTEADLDLANTVQMSDSDSDVLMADGSGPRLSDSDSDVRLTDDDSDATLLPDVDSDSDVKLMGSDDLLSEDSDSDVGLSSGLSRTDSDIRLVEDAAAADSPAPLDAPEDSDLKLIDKGKSDEPDSGITLEPAGSSFKMESDESGISLEIDSGMSLDADDSGISLESFDSGAALGAEDSGITLDAGDSGISLDYGDDSGISLDADDDMNRTMPLDAVSGADAALGAARKGGTQVDMPTSESGRDSEFELAGLDDDDDDLGGSTSVLRFEDDDEEGSDSSKTLATSSSTELESETTDDAFAAEDEFEDDFEDDFDDDDLDDVHDAEDFGDDDFEDEEGGESGFAAPSGPRRYARAEADWGTLTKTGIGIGTLLALVCSVVSFELIRTMWMWTRPGDQQATSSILELFGSLFG